MPKIGTLHITAGGYFISSLKKLPGSSTMLSGYILKDSTRFPYTWLNLGQSSRTDKLKITAFYSLTKQWN